MKHYIKFDTEQFLKDSKGWGKEIKRLDQELKAIPEITGHNDSVPSGNGVSSPTERAVEARDDIHRRVEEIRAYMECFKYAWGCISEADKVILEGFYFSSGYIHRFVEQWTTENASNRQYCYQARREAEKRFGAACEIWMELNGYES